MPQRTDVFDLARLGLTSGRGPPARAPRAHRAVRLRRAAVRRRAGRWCPSASTSRARPANGWALRLRFEVDARRARACAAWSRPRRSSRSTRARSSSPARRRGADLALRRRRRRARPRGLGARRARARAAGPDHVPARLRGPLRAVRREPQRRPGSRHEAEPDPRWAKLSRDPRSTDRVRYPSRRPWPSPSRSSRTRARTSAARQHKISAPAVNACPQCRQPRRPHRVCPQLRLVRRARGRARARPRSRPRPLGRTAVAA